MSKKIGADYIAMGHYAKIKKNKNSFELYQGKDKKKDQSYFLCELSQEDLLHTIFPIGDLTKEEVREIARKNYFPNWNRHGTSGICFVGKVNFQKFLRKKIKEKIGKVLDPEGKVIGYHKGFYYYTIGQRAGEHIGITISKPKNSNKKWYVAEKRKNNSIIVAPKNHKILKKRIMILKKIHKINPKEKIPSNIKVRIRHLGRLYSGELKKKKNQYIFILKKPLEAIAPGQSAVFYKESKLIGGAEIKEVN